jgi:hypothetical protein
MKRANKRATSAGPSTAEHPEFMRVSRALARKAGVTREVRRGFGSGALKVNGKIFAMMSGKGQFVVKLPRERVDELVSSGDGERWGPGPGRVMKEWAAVGDGRVDWLELAHEAYGFVKGLV